MIKNYKKFYAQISSPFHHHLWLAKALRTTNRLIEFIMYSAYFLLIIDLVIKAFSRETTWLIVMPYLLVPGISFILVSIGRHYLNAPRPYEQWAITPIIIREKSGNSMPSRHVFSATIIAMCLFHLNLSLGIIALFLAFLLAIVRVLGGVHYPRDVVVGFMIGLLAGSLLFL